MILDPSVFKAYDVRGKFGEELDAEGGAKIASAFADMIYGYDGTEPPLLVLARDARPSSDPMAEAILSALVSSGAHVLNVGLATTPLFYFAIHHLRADGGIMVTASHNPLPYNGLKLSLEEGIAVGAGAGMEEVKERALSGKITKRPGGRCEEVAVIDSYISQLQSKIRIDRPLGVIIDAGNGMAGLLLDKVLALMPQVKARTLFTDIDCSFPNHEANPVKEKTLQDLKREIKEHPADIGVAFDGDVDRVGFITPSGKTVRGDFVTAIIGRHLLRAAQEPEAVLYEVRSSRVVPGTIKEAGGRPILVKPGHAAINRAMRQHNAVFGGELSGHYFYRDFFFREDAFLTMIVMLNMLAAGEKIDNLVAQLSKYAQSGEINFEISDKKASLARVEAHFKDAKITKLDGLTVEYDDWWFNLRPSNTEDLLRLNVETNSEDILEEKLTELKELILR